MAPKMSPVLVGAFFLILVSVFPSTIQSKSSGFDFIQHLEGCHKGQSVKGLHELKGYLEKFGYLNYKNKGQEHANDDEFDELLESAIKAYQHNHHLNVSGSLDNNTVKQMMMPRCGVPDVVNGNKTHHHHHHNIHGVAHYSFFPQRQQWPSGKSHLTYKFDGGPASTIDTVSVRSACAQAFQRWAQVSHFTFQEVASNAEADIRIGFRRGDHGDGYPFDGRSGTLAHAFAPTHGACHFDEDENWSPNPATNQLDFESVAVHEIGHLLGLHHSQDRNAIMFESFSYGIIKRNLNQDDINGIRALYRL